MQERRRTTGWVKKTVVALGLVSGSLLLGSEGMAQNFSEDVAITTDISPSVEFNQVDIQDLPIQAWTLSGDEVGVVLRDGTSNQAPFSIYAGAPDHSLAVASTGNVGVGIDAPTM